MKLLLLCLGLILVSAHTEGRNHVKRNFDLSKISGKWYTIQLASDQKEKIEENGSMRVFVEYIQNLEKSSLFFKFHTMVNGQCTEISLTADKTEDDDVYTVDYNGENRFTIVDTDYDNYIIFILKNFNNGKTFKLLELYGREPDVSSSLKEKFEKISQKHGINKENILDMTKVDRCLEARGGGKAEAPSAE